MRNPPPTSAGPRPAHSPYAIACKHSAAQQPQGEAGGCRAAWGRVGRSTQQGADTKTQPLTNEKNPALHPALPHKTPPPQPRHGVHSLLQYSEGEAGDEGRAVVGRGSWGRQNKNTWRPPRVKKRAEEEKKNTPVPPPPAPATTRTLPSAQVPRTTETHTTIYFVKLGTCTGGHG